MVMSDKAAAVVLAELQKYFKPWITDDNEGRAIFAFWVRRDEDDESYYQVRHDMVRIARSIARALDDEMACNITRALETHD